MWSVSPKSPPKDGIPPPTCSPIQPDFFPPLSVSVPHSRPLLPGINVHICKLCSNPCLSTGAGDTQSQAGVIIDCDNCEEGEGLRAAVPHSDNVTAEVTAEEGQADH